MGVRHRRRPHAVADRDVVDELPVVRRAAGQPLTAVAQEHVDLDAVMDTARWTGGLLGTQVPGLFSRRVTSPPSRTRRGSRRAAAERQANGRGTGREFLPGSGNPQRLRVRRSL
jgi:hypothetical protein